MGKIILKISLGALVLAHLSIMVLNIASFFIVPFIYPWYIFIPICTVIARAVFVPRSCPLTSLENVIRRRLGLTEIKGFAKHYLYGRRNLWM